MEIVNWLCYVFAIVALFMVIKRWKRQVFFGQREGLHHSRQIRINF
jgi:hypothetical protein